MAKKLKNPTADLNDVAARALAEKIVANIMTDGGTGNLATRLILEHGGRTGSGWAQGPLTDRVHMLLTGQD